MPKVYPQQNNTAAIILGILLGILFIFFVIYSINLNNTSSSNSIDNIMCSLKNPQSCLRIGTSLLESGQYQDAINVFNMVIKYNPSDLTKEDLHSDKYIKNFHPSGAAWNLLTPLFIKQAGITAFLKRLDFYSKKL